MDMILKSIEHATGQGALLPAIITALTVPDIAGAVEYPNQGSQARYINWVDSYFGPIHPLYAAHGIDGVAMYALRCKLLHEGLSSPAAAPVAQKSPLAARKMLVAFSLGTGVVMHLCSMDDGNGSQTILRSEVFCMEMAAAGRTWLASKRNDAVAIAALEKLVDVRTSIPGFIQGVQVLCATV